MVLGYILGDFVEGGDVVEDVARMLVGSVGWVWRCIHGCVHVVCALVVLHLLLANILILLWDSSESWCWRILPDVARIHLVCQLVEDTDGWVVVLRDLVLILHVEIAKG